VAQSKLPFGRVDQVGLVVRDLHVAMERYWALMGLGPWRVYTYGAPFVKDLTYRGQPGTYRMQIALTTKDGLMYELIQPLAGPSLYHEFLERNGDGIHHLGAFVPNFDRAIADCRALGFAVLQSGRGYGVQGDGGYAYLDTVASLGAIYELIEIPAERYPPEEIYPAE
jgi:methylmalonyl-CoA/ethylmalonyl-CoA epimerase